MGRLSIRRRAREARDKVKEALEEVVDSIQDNLGEGDMSVFGRLFGKKKEEITAEDAINQLKDTEAILIRKQEYYEQKIEEEVATAKKYGTKNQRMALNALKRKKHHELELSRIDGTLAKLEAQRAALEDAGTNAEVLKVLADASKSLKKANIEMDIDKVNDLMDDIGEQLQDSNEMSEAISRPIGDLAEEDDLMDELRQLEEESKNIQSSNREKDEEMEMDEVRDLPLAPSGPVTRSKTKVQKQDTMAELEAWAAAN